MRVRLNLKQMLLLGFGAISLVILFNGIYGLKSASKNLSSIKEVSEKGIPRNQLISRLTEGINNYRMSIKMEKNSLSAQVKNQARIDEEIASTTIKESFSAFNKLALSERAANEIAEIERKYEAWVPIIEQLSRSNSLDTLTRIEIAENEMNYYSDMIKSINSFNDRMDDLVLYNTNNIYDSMNEARANRNISLLIPIFLALGIGFVIQFDIKKNMKKELSNLENGNNQNLSASNQISESSQSLAGASSQQAASVEQASATLEEISSTALNAKDDADQAVYDIENKVVKESEVVQNRMANMKDLLEETVKTSKETTKIIASIDELAFQTNLLALNAAVEAARAGDAGAGFAVVAEEVRNLASKSAQAAKVTAELIESSNAKTTQMFGLGENVSESIATYSSLFDEALDTLKTVKSSADYQVEGVEQLKIAVNQIEQATQSNAASAEQLAASTEQLSAQANEFKQVVHSIKSYSAVH